MNLFKTNRKTKINVIILGGKSSGTTKKWCINTEKEIIMNDRYLFRAKEGKK